MVKATLMKIYSVQVKIIESDVEMKGWQFQLRIAQIKMSVLFKAKERLA